MAKKDKQKQTKSSQKKKNPLIWIIGAVAVVVIIMAVTDTIPLGGSKAGKTKSFTVQGGETRPTLEPSIFSGMTRAAYASAKAYPQVLAQVYCYCYCDDPPFYHKSLLSCFVDKHGAN
jgi:flagellar basal body-associated protein FliL